MLFSLFALLPALSTITAIPTQDLSYAALYQKRQQGCQAGSLFCNSPSTFSICAPSVTNGTREVFFGSVAAGTYCDTTENRIRADNAGNCSPDGALICSADGNTFFICDQGGKIPFGSVAAGTFCQNGTIVAN